MTGSIAIESFVIAVVLALGLGRLCMAVALRMRWVDRPGHRKIHRKPVPYLGGLALALAVVLVASGFVLLSRPALPAGFSLAALQVCAWPALFAVALGLWDDLYDLNARYKFVGQALVAMIFGQFAYRFSVLHVPGFSPWVMEPEIAVLVTAFFIVSVTNGFNMMDGSDALCLGASMTTFLVVALAAHWQGQEQFAFVGLVVGGACLGLLFWNRPPARMYMGDAGSQGLGFLLACMLVALGQGEPGQFVDGVAAQPFHYQMAVACLMVGWPALEVVLTVLRRRAQGHGLGVADQGHFHHRLARLGMTPASIVLTAVLLNLLCGAVVLSFLADEKGLSVLLMLPLVALLSLGLLKMGFLRFFQRDWLDERRPYFAIASHFAAMQTAKLKLARDKSEVTSLVEHTCKEFGIHTCRVNMRDAAGKRWSWAWSEPHPPHHAISSDRLRIAGTRNHASWSVDSHDNREPELSMNLRVIMAEFMRRALERMADLTQERALDPEAQAPGSGEHRASLMSTKGFKQRLHRQ